MSSSALAFFRDLGLRVLERWREADLDQRAFPDVATAALADRPPSAYIDPMDVVRWVHEAPSLSPQADIESKFGQPAITVFRCEEFHIDVLFWVDGTTAIHQHGFSGAFHVLRGSSLQSTYRFTPRRRYSEQLMSGELDVVDVELLVAGDVRPIVAGTGFIHSLFHLDRPSVSVVIRTPSDAIAGPQYSYSRNGLAFDPFAKSEATTRKIQTLDLLHTLGHPEFEKLARATFERADAFQVFRIVTHFAKRLEPQDRYLAFLTGLRPAHRELLDALARHVEDERRDDYIIARRRLAKEPEHRFALALLLTLTDRHRVLDMIRRCYPNCDPVDTVLRWLGELAKLDAVNAWVHQVSSGGVKGGAPSILDVAFDEGSVPVARQLLEGATDALAFDRLRETHRPEIVLAKCTELRKSPLLRPLFGI